MSKPRLILASKSPRRCELLRNTDTEFEVCVSGADEDKIPKDLPPQLYVQELAVLKGTSVADGYGKNCYVIAADTVVVHNDQIIGKPKDAADAKRILTSLSGDTHFVYTGFSVTDASNMHTVSGFEVTEVHFKDLSETEIDEYIASGAPFDKAGGYGIQGRAGLFADSIKGDFFNVVGLPLCALNNLMVKEFNISL